MSTRFAKRRQFCPALLMVVAAWACSGKSGTHVDPSPGNGGSAGATTGTGGGAGSVGTGGTDGGIPPDGPPSFGPGPCDPSKSLAPARIWQLTDDEYVAVVRSVFGVSLAPADVPSTEPGSNTAYTNYSERRQIGDAAVTAYDRAAEAIGAQAASKLASLVPCAAADAGTDDAGAVEGCIEAFLHKTAARAFRRPVSDEEVTDWMALYRLAAATDGPAAGVGLVLQEIVMSPYFLFRTELGTGAATATAPVTLTAHELASALSFTFLGSSPDDALWDAAQAGTLVDPSVLASEVDRLMALPEAHATLTRKSSYWLGTQALAARQKNGTIFPEYTQDVEADLERSAEAFVRDVTFDGKLVDLFQSSTIYVNARLGNVYGISGATDTDLVRVTATAPERSAGILSQPAALAAMNHWDAVAEPVNRGLFVYRALLCGGNAGDLPPDPVDPVTAGETMSGRQRDKASERAKTSCSACHDLIDPIGLTFERYDAIGRYSETRYVYGDPLLGNALSWKTSSAPIDTSAVLDDKLGSEMKGPVDGVNGLAQKLLGAKKRVAFCGARHLVEYSLGHDQSTASSCPLRSAQDTLDRTGSFVEMYRALVTSPGFLRRDPVK
jgi:hypothetical protein